MLEREGRDAGEKGKGCRMKKVRKNLVHVALTK